MEPIASLFPFHFADSVFLSLLFFLPAGLLLFLWRMRQSQKLMLRFMDPYCLNTLTGSSFYLRVRRQGVFFVSAVFLILALARPQSENLKEEEVTVQSSEVMLIADVSHSMMVEDMGTSGTRGLSRLQVMKRELARLVSMAPGSSRWGLIAFAGSATLLSPLTRDHLAIKLYLDSLSPQSVAVQGTHFPAAFEMALKALKRGGDLTHPHVIVLASDGEDNEGGVSEVERIFKKEGLSASVRVFVMGLGSQKKGLIPLYDSTGRRQGYKKDRQGNVVYSRFNPRVLKDMAKAFGGEFFSVSPGGGVVQKIHRHIQNFKTDKEVVGRAGAYTEWYPPFVVLSLLLGGLFFLMREKGRSDTTQNDKPPGGRVK